MPQKNIVVGRAVFENNQWQLVVIQKPTRLEKFYRIVNEGRLGLCIGRDENTRWEAQTNADGEAMLLLRR